MRRVTAKLTIARKAYFFWPKCAVTEGLAHHRLDFIRDEQLDLVIFMDLYAN